MKYTVIPFVPSLKAGKNTISPSDQLENLINKMQQKGWVYIRVENITTRVPGDSGCFGFGSTPDSVINRQMVVFKLKQ